MDGNVEEVTSDAVLIATGASPRELDTAKPDGERIFNWKQLYSMDDLPEHMVVVGSGVTGAEFASAYQLLGSNVTLVSSRETLLPGEDPDAAQVLEEVFAENGVNVISRTRAEAVTRIRDGVRVELSHGGYVEGSHCLLAVGGIPNTSNLGLEDIGVEMTASGHIKIDAVSRTSVPGIYAAGDCTGRLALASVAAMQGRIAVNHLLGDVVSPFSRNQVASNIFTSAEIATVGLTAEMISTGEYQVDEHVIPMASNPRAKMMNVEEGFVKIFARRGSGHVVGGVIVAPRASDLISISRNQVASNIFTSAEIATVGLTAEMISTGEYQVDEHVIPMASNPRAKMMNVEEGFVKIFARRGSGHVVGGVIVAPRASDLI